jgi:hypothetical protein
MRTTLRLFACATVLSLGSSAFAGILNFDNIDATFNVPLSTQYSTSGIIFNGDQNFIDSFGGTGNGFLLTTAFSDAINIPSPPNWVGVVGGWGGDSGVSTFDIVGGASFVSLDFPSLVPFIGGSFDGMTVSALDAGNNILGSHVVAPADAGSQPPGTISFSYTGIYHIQFSDRVQYPGGPSAFGFDNLTFAPEPMTPLLLLSGLAAIATRKRRRRA